MEEEINRLRFENKIWILFAFLCLLNIRGDDDDINYIKTNNNKYKNESNNIFKFTLICTLFIYLYFFRRNVRFYNKANSMTALSRAAEGPGPAMPGNLRCKVPNPAEDRPKDKGAKRAACPARFSIDFIDRAAGASKLPFKYPSSLAVKRGATGIRKGR